ncbi:Hsp70 family protein [Leifsonia flava]|uniref:Hsp70 family protein n=1 Tax=Orlajensenia leifsoniae TaxID=2561933 RepID=A0A4Y9R2D7_9MICO|nr:Hsp70 family protein [Leifsonia flava]TFV98779.1 Hsp70 family protein [Leifsonia flava]
MTKSPLFLAVDVGASRTAAAIARFGPDGLVSTTPFLLGRHTDSVPSAIFVGDGELLFGDAAERRGIAQPERLVREFKRRIGDATPIRAGDRRFTPEQLFALMVSWIVDCIAEREGERPTALSVSIPASWGEHRSGLVASALERAGWRDVRFISEPEAAARHYAFERSLVPGSLLAVYDLGGGTFDAALVRIEDDRSIDIVGDPVGLDAFGGADFDDAVIRHVVRAARLSLDDLAADGDSRVGLAALRREAIDAKEALSFDSETVVPVLMGDGDATVRLTRAEFEEMIEDGIERTVDVVANLLESANKTPEGVAAILLTGGSSRIPRVAQLLSERFDRPVAVDADPKAAISLGAVRAIADADADHRPVLVDGHALELDPRNDDDTRFDENAAPFFVRLETSGSWQGRAATIAGVAIGAIVLVVGIAVAALSPSHASRGPQPGPGDTPPSSSTPHSSISPTPSTEPLLTPAPADVVTDLFP